jgi:diacylglycerol kinase family enzyme
MSSANQARLANKQAELEGLRALKEQSARLVKELERLAEKVDVMADGGDGTYNSFAVELAGPLGRRMTIH